MCCFHLFYMFLLLSWGDREKEEKRFLIVLLFNRDLSPLKVRTKFSFHCVRTLEILLVPVGRCFRFPDRRPFSRYSFDTMHWHDDRTQFPTGVIYRAQLPST